MSHGNKPSVERLLWWLIAATVSLELLANVLPRLLPAMVVLAVIFVAIRLVLFHTRKW